MNQGAKVDDMDKRVKSQKVAFLLKMSDLCLFGKDLLTAKAQRKRKERK